MLTRKAPPISIYSFNCKRQLLLALLNTTKRLGNLLIWLNHFDFSIQSPYKSLEAHDSVKIVIVGWFYECNFRKPNSRLNWKLANDSSTPIIDSTLNGK